MKTANLKSPPLTALLETLAKRERKLDAETATELLNRVVVQGDDGPLQPATVDLFERMLEKADSTEVGRAAIRAFLAGVRPQVPAEAPRGVLAKWFGRSPPPARAEILDGARAAGRGLEVARAAGNAKSAMEVVLSSLDPVLLQTITQSSKYSVGLAGLATLYPELQTALSRWQGASPSEREAALTLIRTTLEPLEGGLSYEALAREAKAGRPIDERAAMDLARAAVLSGKDQGRELAALAAGPGTQLGKVFLAAFAQGMQRGASVEDAFFSASDALRSATDTLTLFDDALAHVDPKLAENGHTRLLTDPQFANVRAAFFEIQKIDSENPRETAGKIMASRLRT